MKIINKRQNYEYDTDYNNKDILIISKLIIEFLKNKENTNKKDIFDLLCYFYDIKIDNTDYLEYVNSIREVEYTSTVEIPTNKVVIESGSEGHGRDFSWWTQNYQICIKAFSSDFVVTKDEYTIEEVLEFCKSGEIYPIHPFGRKTKKKYNNISDNIDYLTKYVGKKLESNDIYFDFMVDKALTNIGVKTLIEEIRLFIIKLKLNSVIDEDRYYGEKIETFDELSSDLINIYNENVKGSKIEKTPLEIVLKYLRELPKGDSWYEEVTLEQIMNVFSEIDEEEERELCSSIEELVISLGEAELCYEMASNFDWVDKKVMAEIVINDGNPDINYYFASEVEGADIQRHKEVILNSKYTDDYILERAKNL